MSSEFRIGGANIASVVARSGDPGAVTSRVRVYSKDVGGITQLFMQESDGTVLPIEASRVVRVDPNGSVATITAGLAAAVALTPTASNPVVVWVAPATYTEAAGITIPLGVTLASMGRSPESATIIASVTGPVVTLSDLSTIDGFTVRGAGIAGTIGIELDETGTAFVKNCTIHDCTTYVHVGTAGVVNASALKVIKEIGDIGTTGILIDTTGVFRATGVSIVGLAGSLFTDGFLVTGASSHINSVGDQIVNCVDGVHVESGAEAHIYHIGFSNNTNGCRVDSGGFLHTNVLHIEDSTAFDIIAASGSTWVDSASSFDESKRLVATGANVASISITEEPTTNEFAVSMLGELHVGDENNPSESTFGGGDSHIRGLRAFRSVSLDAGAFTDLTTEITSPTGSGATLFDTGAIGNTFFIGGDVAFPNVKFDTTTAIVLGAGVLVFEISDGVGGWIDTAVMATDDVAPYSSHARDVWGRVANEHMRIGTVAGWGSQAINGVTKFWVRIRIIAAVITTPPVVEFAKLGTNRTEINGDGTLQFFGTGEQVRPLIWHQRLVYDLSGAASGNNNIVVSANITLSLKDNQFANSARDGIGGIAVIPEGLDTSKPTKLIWHWIAKATGGNVEFQTDSAPVRVGDTLDGTLADTNQAVVAAAPAIDVLTVNEFEYDISSLEPGEFVAFNLTRDARNGNDPPDTFNGNINIVTIAVTGTFWR